MIPQCDQHPAWVSMCGVQGLVSVFDGLERAAATGGADEQRQSLEAAGAVLLDLETTAKHAPRLIKVCVYQALGCCLLMRLFPGSLQPLSAHTKCLRAYLERYGEIHGVHAHAMDRNAGFFGCKKFEVCQHTHNTVTGSPRTLLRRRPCAMQVWHAKLRPEQPTPFSVAVALTLTGIRGCQVASSGMLKVSAPVYSHGLPPDTGCPKGQ